MLCVVSRHAFLFSVKQHRNKIINISIYKLKIKKRTENLNEIKIKTEKIVLLTLIKCNRAVLKEKCKTDKMNYKANEHEMWQNVKNVIMQCIQRFIDGFALEWVFISMCECVTSKLRWLNICTVVWLKLWVWCDCSSVGSNYQAALLVHCNNCFYLDWVQGLWTAAMDLPDLERHDMPSDALKSLFHPYDASK